MFGFGRKKRKSTSKKRVAKSTFKKLPSWAKKAVSRASKSSRSKGRRR